MIIAVETPPKNFIMKATKGGKSSKMTFMDPALAVKGRFINVLNNGRKGRLCRVICTGTTQFTHKVYDDFIKIIPSIFCLAK
jgi:hypothetical protein